MKKKGGSGDIEVVDQAATRHANTSEMGAPSPLKAASEFQAAQ